MPPNNKRGLPGSGGGCGTDASNDACKWCLRLFSSLNPVVADPSPDDTLKRRTAGSRECRPCFNFQKSDPNYATMSATALQSHLAEDTSNLDTYRSSLARWEEGRRQGKRATSKASSSTKVVAEQSTALTTEEVLGYHWPLALLRKHDIEIPKKLTTIYHAGKAIKGLTRGEWVLGAIKVVQTGSKSCKRLHEEVAPSDSDDDTTEQTFATMQNGIRARTTDDLQIKMASKNSSSLSTLDDAFTDILFGAGGFSSGTTSTSSGANVKDSACDSDQDMVPDKRPRKATRRNSSASALALYDAAVAQLGTGPGAPSGAPPDAVSSSGAAAADTSTSASMMWGAGIANPKARKHTAESKELDRSEAVLLAASQLQVALQNSETIMTVQLSKTNALLDKLKARVSDDLISVYSEAVRRDGGDHSRAATVWASLREKIEFVSSAASFVEALHDSEASSTTLSTRAAALRAHGVTLPDNVTTELCKRSLTSMVQSGDFKTFFNFLVPGDKNVANAGNDVGVMSLVGGEQDDDKVSAMLVDFRMGSVMHALSSMLLSPPTSAPVVDDPDTAPAEKAEKEQLRKRAELAAGVARVVDFFKAYRAADFHGIVVSNCKKELLDDLDRLEALASAAAQETQLTTVDCDAIAVHRTSLLKSKQGPFYKGLTLFPVGMHMSDIVSQKIQQCKTDQLLSADVIAAAQVASDLKRMTLDNLLKGDTGDVAVPSQHKFMDMVSKWVAARETGSSDFHAANKESMIVLENKIGELKEGLMAVVAHKTKDFAGLADLLTAICSNTSADAADQIAQCNTLITGLAACQPLHKVPVAKLVGKQHCQDLDGTISQAWSFFAHLSATFALLLKLSQVSASEGVIMDQQIIDLYTMVHDAGVVASIVRVAPWIKSFMTYLREFLQSNAKAWITSAAASFRMFSTMMMEPEPAFARLLSKEVIPSSTDVDVDFCFIYMSFVKHMSGQEQMLALPMSETGAIAPAKAGAPDAGSAVAEGAVPATRSVHAAYACVCGALVQLSGHVLAFIDAWTALTCAAPFPELMQKCIEALKANDKSFVFKSKFSHVASLQVLFEKVSLAMRHIDAILTDVGSATSQNMVFDQVSTHYANVCTHFQSAVTSVLHLINQDVDALAAQGRDLYTKVCADHDVPALFRADPLNKQAITALVQDASGQLLVLFAAKASESLQMACSYTAAMRAFEQSKRSPRSPDEAVMTATNAMDKDIELYRQSGGVLPSLNEFQANLTMSQALVRDLGPGETRLGLVSKCYNVAQTKGISLEAALKKRAVTMTKGK